MTDFLYTPGPGAPHRARGDGPRRRRPCSRSRPRARTSSPSPTTGSGTSRTSSPASSKPAPSRTRRNAGYCQRHEVIQGTWSRPQSNSLLFDARRHRQQVQLRRLRHRPLPVATTRGAAAASRTTCRSTTPASGFTYNGVGSRTMSLSHQSNGRFNVSLISGPHTLKTGVFWMYGLGGGHRTYTERAPTQVNGLPVSYSFFNGAPRSLTQFASPVHTVDQLNPDLGLFVQDQWRLNRVTVSAGVRFDWLRESVKETSVPAGVLVPARTFPARTDVPELEGPQPAVRHRLGSEGGREDGDQVRHQPLRAVEHDRAGAALRPGGRRGEQHHALLERPVLCRRRPTAQQLPARLRPGAHHRQRRMRRDGQPELRHLRAGQLARRRTGSPAGASGPTTGRPRSTSTAKWCPTSSSTPATSAPGTATSR